MLVKTARRRSAGLATVVAAALLAPLARAQIPKDRVVDSAGYHSPQERARKARDGASVEEMSARLSDPDPAERLAAVRSLVGSGDPEVKDHLVRSLDDADPRVQVAAIDGLAQLRASDASPALAQRLFLKGASKGVRERILSALARIGDPVAARSILDFARDTPDADLRASALYALGEIGDASIRPDLEDFANRQTDPNSKRIATEALAKIASRSPTESGGTR
jgi:HEAT repeat protein